MKRCAEIFSVSFGIMVNQASNLLCSTNVAFDASRLLAGLYGVYSNVFGFFQISASTAEERRKEERI